MARLEKTLVVLLTGSMMDTFHREYTKTTDQLLPDIIHGVFNEFLKQMVDLLG
jgi:hypothetical protein